MAAKKKQNVVTIEELKLKIKHEKASYWLHSLPLFGIIKNQDTYHFLPVDPVIDNKILIFFVLDPADYTSERILELIELFKDRYQGLPWLSAAVFDQKYMFTKNPIFWDHFKKYPAYNTLPTYLDSYEEFFKWAKIDKFSKVFFYQGGEVVKEFTLDGNAVATFLELESELQNLFRVNDRGLPLPLLYEYQLDSPVDKLKVGNNDVIFKGHWTMSSDNAMTDDFNSVLSIPFEGKSLRLIASLHTTAREAASRVIVTFNDKPVHPSCVTPFLIADSHGTTTFEITRFQGVYDLFNSNEVQRGTLQLHFKNAANSPIVYWGTRIG